MRHNDIDAFPPKLVVFKSRLEGFWYVGSIGQSFVMCKCRSFVASVFLHGRCPGADVGERTD
eukprot:4727173-Pleurochrysis_carterae.AAC.1